MDYRTLLYRAIGVPDAVVDKTHAAAWVILAGAGLEGHERFELLLKRMYDGTAAALLDDIIVRLETGEFDPLFVHRPGTTVDEIAGRICTATLHLTKIEPWRGRAVPVSRQLWHGVCVWVVTQVVTFVRDHQFASA